jgi:hypothetical protein
VADGLPVIMADCSPESGFPLAQKETVKGWNTTALRGFGNAIVPPLSAEFISAFMEVIA